jgi:hypothetical protein
MVQGSAKLSKKTKSAAAAKKKVSRTKTVTKGRKEFKLKSSTRTEKADEIATTKAINRKNEASAAAKAVSVGTQFFLTDIASTGKIEMNKKLKERNKKQSNGGIGRSTERLRDKLRKLERDV